VARPVESRMTYKCFGVMFLIAVSAVKSDYELERRISLNIWIWIGWLTNCNKHKQL